MKLIDDESRSSLVHFLFCFPQFLISALIFVFESVPFFCHWKKKVSACYDLIFREHE